ncbi:unnamed protein product [Heterobilharzia americana]|nr:unnamed protein product [Heterobilharzia americana]
MMIGLSDHITSSTSSSSSSVCKLVDGSSVTGVTSMNCLSLSRNTNTTTNNNNNNSSIMNENSSKQVKQNSQSVCSSNGLFYEIV